MSWLELIGASTLYVTSVIVSGYAAFAVVSFIQHQIDPLRGLEAIVLPLLIALLVWICGAIGGILLLGTQLAS